MKTLDEVIESITTQSGLEIRNVRKPERDRFWVDRDTYNDALLYLKEYQKIEDEYEELKDWWAEEHEENVPLSWDELKGMEGKPVWVECFGGGDWMIVYKCLDDFIRFRMPNGRFFIGAKTCGFEKDNICTDWKAYRKERK